MEHWKTLKAHNGLQCLTLRALLPEKSTDLFWPLGRDAGYIHTQSQLFLGSFIFDGYCHFLLCSCGFYSLISWDIFPFFMNKKIILSLLTWLAFDNQDHKFDSYVPVNSGLKRLIAHTVDQRKRNKWNEFSMAKWICVAANVAWGGMNVGLLSHSIG